MDGPHEILGKHLTRLVPALASMQEEILPSFQIKTVSKNEIIVEEGQPSPNCLYFVVKGLLNLYYTDKNGQQTIHFAMENWWIAEYPSLTSDNHAAFSISAIEDAVLLYINKSRYNELLHTCPPLAIYFNIIHQRAYAAALMKQKVFAVTSASDFHQYFFTKFPEFVNRVPEEILASYMHISVTELRLLNEKFFLKPA